MVSDRARKIGHPAQHGLQCAADLAGADHAHIGLREGPFLCRHRFGEAGAVADPLQDTAYHIAGAPFGGQAGQDLERPVQWQACFQQPGQLLAEQGEITPGESLQDWEAKTLGALLDRVDRQQRLLVQALDDGGGIGAVELTGDDVSGRG